MRRVVGGVRVIALLISLSVTIVTVAIVSGGRPAPPAGAQTLEADDCLLDEQISFAPVAPVADQEMLIAVSSARHHRGVYLTGTARATARSEYEGQRGWVWTWVAVPSYAGLHQFQFFVDSTTFCTQGAVDVGPSVHPVAQPTEVGLGLGQQAGNQFTNADNGSGSDNDSGDNSSNDNSGGDNDDGDNGQSKPRLPRIASLSSPDTCPGARLSLLGSGFGHSQTEVDGKVVVGGSEVRDYLSWQPTQIVVLVPSGASTGQDRDIYVITEGGFSQRTVNVFPPPC